jgi:hypothetical protein
MRVTFCKIGVVSKSKDRKRMRYYSPALLRNEMLKCVRRDGEGGIGNASKEGRDSQLGK